jgi:signal transduction histidine kinase
MTARKQADDALRRLNRELRAIRDCSRALMRAEDEQSLLGDICRIVCDEAGYRMAWIGYAEHDDARTIRPVAWAGVEDGYLAQAEFSWAETERGRGPSGTAIRSGRSACVDDFATDPSAAPWRESALQRGYRSSISLPLKNENGNTFGVLTVYSTEPDSFTPDERRLLEDLAGDTAFGIRVLRARIERKRVDEALLFVAQRGWQTGGEDFFSALAQFLGEKLDMDYALIDRIDENPGMAETVALYAKGAITPNMRYALRGTPCENVMGRRLCVYPHGIQQLFPDDALLPGMGAESYVGIPLWDSTGLPIGLIAVMGTKPLPDDAPVTHLLQLVATRAAAELERRRAEEHDRKLNQELERRVVDRTAELERANKELEAFSYSVSHDLRAPLRAIGGFSQILLDDYAAQLDDEGKRLLNVVRDNTTRMESLIDDLLSFSRSGRGEFTRSDIDMEKLAREVFDEFPPAFAGKATLDIGPLPRVRGDRTMMRQVFVNLLSNAIKYSGIRESARIQVGGSVVGDEAICFVKDNGVGFDMQYVGRLFEVFQRLHRSNDFEGTGIGLAIVKRVVTRHGGRVWAEGEIGKGATFYFALPLAAG